MVPDVEVETGVMQAGVWAIVLVASEVAFVYTYGGTTVVHTGDRR